MSPARFPPWEAEQHSLTIVGHTHAEYRVYVYPCKCNKMQWNIGREWERGREREREKGRERIVSVLGVHRPVYALFRVC